MINTMYVVALIGAIVGLIIGIIVFSEISPQLDCGVDGDDGFEECNFAKSTAWSILGILPVMFWFSILGLFGRFTGGGQQ